MRYINSGDIALRMVAEGLVYWGTLFRLSIWGLIPLLVYDFLFREILFRALGGGLIYISMNHLLLAAILSLFVPNIVRYGATDSAPPGFPAFTFSEANKKCFVALILLVIPYIVVFSPLFIIREFSIFYMTPSILIPVGFVFALFVALPLWLAMAVYIGQVVMESTLSLRRLLSLLRGTYRNFVFISGFLLIFSLALAAMGLLISYLGFSIFRTSRGGAEYIDPNSWTDWFSIFGFFFAVFATVYGFGFLKVAAGALYARLAADENEHVTDPSSAP